MKKVKPVVLFATPVLRHPPHGGPSLRIENSIKALSQISDLYVYSRIGLKEIGGKQALSFYEQYCRKFCFAPFILPKGGIRFAKRLLNFAARKLIRRNVFSLSWEKREDFGGLLDVANEINADVIWLGYGNISYPLLKYIKANSNYKVVVDTDSVWSRFIMRGLPYAVDDKQREKISQKGRGKEEEEEWGTPLADLTTAVSEVDADYYRGLARDPCQVHLFSNVVDLETYKDIPAPPADFAQHCMYLAGTFWSRSPMEQAARWIISEVLPLVRKQVADVHFYIVGNGSDQVLEDVSDSGITVAGQLPSVLPYLCHSDVALVPLKFESGTRFKILEAGACGIPIVSTTLGAEGLPVTHGKDILIADDHEAFANCIVKVIRDQVFATGMAVKMRGLVHEKYSVEGLAKEGRTILEYLLGNERKLNELSVGVQQCSVETSTGGT